MNAPKSTPRLLSVLAVALSLAGCQSMSGLGNVAGNSPEQAKQHLEKSLRTHMRSSFSYHTSLSVYAQQGKLEDKYCSDYHDDAYIALAEEAHAAGLDVSADRYIEAREEIKSAYLACDEHSSAAVAVAEAAMAAAIAAETQDANLAAAVAIEDMELAAAEVEKAEMAEEVALEAAPPEPSAHDLALQKRGQALIDGYLIRPLTLEVTGNYQPLKGVVTALPSLSYRAKNISAMINQPVYIDLKAQTLYLWADNLAIVNTQLDKKLGLAWQNKWLKLPLNDGSLPENFSKDLFNNYLNSQKDAFAAAEASAFSYVAEQARPAGLDATVVIAHSDGAGLQHDVLQRFFDKMTSSYPELLQTPNATVHFDSKLVMQRTFAALAQHLVAASVHNPATTYYGLDATGRLQWIRQDIDARLFADKVKVDALVTRFYPNVAATPFPRLGAQALPNADNSIDLLVYGDELIHRLKQSNDHNNWLGSVWLSALLGKKAYYAFSESVWDGCGDACVADFEPSSDSHGNVNASDGDATAEDEK